MSIFDPDFNRIRNNAYLNWWFDHRNKDKEIQVAWDFFNLGKAYYGNAVTSLSLIIDSHNMCDIADKLIFPILFGFWHGTELLLKSCLILAERETETGKRYSKNTHDINQLFSELMSRLKLKGFKEKDFSSLKSILDDFKSKNALCTFMRYTVDDKWNDQFFVELTASGENTCINLPEFTEKLFNIVYELSMLTEFLGVPYFGDMFSKGELSKANFDLYVAESERLEEKFKIDEDKFTDNLDVTNKVLRWVHTQLL